MTAAKSSPVLAAVTASCTSPEIGSGQSELINASISLVVSV